jgi:N-acyl-D-aspartate/D-glutamate deacylase
MPARFDLVVRNGTIADGSGGPLIEADVAMTDGRIVEIGHNVASGREEIDARGKLVTPGFVDLHTHFDGQSIWDSRLAPTSWHGVTTVMMGNCGVGFAPVRETDRNRLIDLMEGVEDIPNPCLHQGLDWKWETYGEYLNAVERRSHDVDICSLLPHAALRVYVMGERAMRLEPATLEDSETMRKIAAQAAKDGAFGFSTSRAIGHKSKKGDQTPTYQAEERELTSIGLGISEGGPRLMQFITDWDMPDVETEFGMLQRAVEKSGCTGLVSVFQRHSVPNLWRDVMRMCRESTENGVSIRPIVAPRTIGLMFSLQGTQNPFSGTPSYIAIADQPLEKRVAIMRDPDFKKRVLSEDRFALSTFTGLIRTSFDRMFRFEKVNYLPDPHDSIAAIAEREGRTAEDVIYDILLEKNGKQLVYTPIANFHEANSSVCQQMIEDENAVIGLSDGGAHVGVILDASFPTFLLTYWGQEKKAFDIPHLVRRHTRDNARAIGLEDRGTIELGMKADLNVIDLDRLGLELPYMVRDLPANGVRLMQKASGYNATIVSGIPTYRDGVALGPLPGKVVRGPQARPN